VDNIHGRDDEERHQEHHAKLLLLLLPPHLLSSWSISSAFIPLLSMVSSSAE
jgi:hypothetical protein